MVANTQDHRLRLVHLAGDRICFHPEASPVLCAPARSFSVVASAIKGIAPESYATLRSGQVFR
jgi:hypothetical protein